MTPHHTGSRSLRQVIGEGVRRVREAAGVRQDDLARGARLYGLAWDHSRISALERGEKSISAEELFLLPVILTDVCRLPPAQPVTLEELIPDGEDIQVNPMVTADGSTVRGVYAGQSVSGLARFRAAEEITERVMTALDEGGTPGVAEERAAKRLGTSTAAVTALSRTMWGRTLTEERDRIVSERPDAGGDPERLRALRGRVTRALVGQLADESRKRERKGDGEESP